MKSLHSSELDSCALKSSPTFRILSNNNTTISGCLVKCNTSVLKPPYWHFELASVYFV